MRTASHFALPIALHICFAHLRCTFALHIDLHTCFANLLCTFALDIRLAHSLCAFALRMTDYLVTEGWETATSTRASATKANVSRVQ